MLTPEELMDHREMLRLAQQEIINKSPEEWTTSDHHVYSTIPVLLAEIDDLTAAQREHAALNEMYQVLLSDADELHVKLQAAWEREVNYREVLGMVAGVHDALMGADNGYGNLTAFDVFEAVRQALTAGEGGTEDA